MSFIYNHPIQPLRIREETRQKKWGKILAAFFDGDIDLLVKIARSGTRGRIFQELFSRMLTVLKFEFTAEPVFGHRDPNPWYSFFLDGENGLQLRTLDEYNPDYVLGKGDWAEVTLSENMAYKKILPYGHQAPKLEVFWLDDGTGHHKDTMKDIPIPNASVHQIDYLYRSLDRSCPSGKLAQNLIEPA